MCPGESPVAEFKVGTYLCPEKKTVVILKATSPLPFHEWPFVVEKCEACGKKHLLQSEDVEHPPAFGYE